MILATLSSLLLILGAQLILGAALFRAAAGLSGSVSRRTPARRRRMAVLTRCWRATRPSLPLAFAAAGAGLWLARGVRLDPIPTAPLAALALLGSVSTAGCWLLLHAGWAEARGRFSPARSEARVGGFVMLLGSMSMIVATWVELLFHVPFRRAVALESATTALWAAGGMLALGFGGFVGLLAGLSGKPRPSGGFAVPLYLGGVVGLVVTRHLV